MKQYIKEVHIKGFKKLQEFTAELNDDVNIIIDKNESGKSSFLETINIVINQIYKNTDKSFLEELLNKNDISKFNSNLDLFTIPNTVIDIVLNLGNLPKNKEKMKYMV